MEVLQIISLSFGIVSSGFTLLLLISDRFRQLILKNKKQKEAEEAHEENQRETDKCLLRDAFMANYRYYKAEKKIDHDGYKNMEHIYNQYKKLGGNSFVDRLWEEEVRHWSIVTF